MTGIAKRFGETVALAAVDFTAARGEFHGLLGENGAGKTTLMNVLSGLYRADQGAIAIDGVPAAIASPSDALGHGIGMVHQHVELVANFSVLENVLLGREGGGFWLRPEGQRRSVEAIAGRFEDSLAACEAARQELAELEAGDEEARSTAAVVDYIGALATAQDDGEHTCAEAFADGE